MLQNKNAQMWHIVPLKTHKDNAHNTQKLQVQNEFKGYFTFALSFQL